MGVRWHTMLIRGQSREVWIFSPIASFCTTLWKTICCPCLLASLAFLFPKLRANKQSKHCVVSEKIHTPMTDGILEILVGGVSMTLEIQVGEGFFNSFIDHYTCYIQHEKVFCRGNFDPLFTRFDCLVQ